MVLQRYTTVHWAKASRKSLIDTIARPGDVQTTLDRALVVLKDATASSQPGTTAATLLEHVPNYLRDPTTWWHSHVIGLILASVDLHVNQGMPGHLAMLHLHFRDDGTPFCPPVGSHGQRRPWTCLSNGWLSKTTTGVISSANDTHFVAIAIFGPQKLVIIYDGAEGMHDAPGLWEVGTERAEFGPDLMSLAELDSAVEIPFVLGSPIQPRTRRCCEWVANGTERFGEWSKKKRKPLAVLLLITTGNARTSRLDSTDRQP